jgi:hypothetical protein
MEKIYQDEKTDREMKNYNLERLNDSKYFGPLYEDETEEETDNYKNKKGKFKSLERELENLELEINFLKKYPLFNQNKKDCIVKNEEKNIFELNQKKKEENYHFSVIEIEYNELKTQIFHLQRSNREVKKFFKP